MSGRWKSRMVPLGLAAAAYLIALLQRPGVASSDTKIDLHVDPAGFLSDVASVWTNTNSLGHVQGGQYGGYLFPMGPFFAALNALGLPPWLVHRLWLGTLLAVAAWGTVRLLDALLDRRRGTAHLAAGALVLLNPFVVVFANRTSVTLLGYALLPWMLLVAHRGVHAGRPWRYAAAFALLVTASGGGVNAATTAWLLPGPALLVLYELYAAGGRPRAAIAFAWRAALASFAASLWWIAPVVAHARYGIDFLQFTEQPGSIWGTTSLTESLRLMGYWISYLGVGYAERLQPYFGTSPTLLFDPAVVTASLLVPALALTGFVWTRRWRYGPFFLALVLIGLLVMVAGFPEGTPLRDALNFTYNRVTAVQFLRTSYKAAPLVALGIACLGGAAAAELWRRVPGLPDGGAARVAAPVAGVALIALAAWPMVTGKAVDRETSWERIPPAWTAAARGLDRDLPPNSRALILPGQPFAFYRWGGTIDPILPALTERPVAVRNVPPYADLHAVDALWTVDSLVQQNRLLPGQLPPLLDLLGARAVITATDDDSDRSGATPPAEAARALSGQPGFAAPAAAYGPERRFGAAREGLDPPATLPEVRRYDAGRGAVVSVRPATGPTVVDGSAETLAGMASLGALGRERALVYAGDRTPSDLRRAAARGGADFVIGDSNRRRVFVASRTRQTTGATLPAQEEASVDAAQLNPFPLRGPDAQTVAEYEGARTVRAPFSPGFAQFPEHRPYAAFDGSLDTSWRADPTLDESRDWVEVVFDRPRDVPSIEVVPHEDPRAVVTAVRVGERTFPVRRGVNRLRLGLRGASRLRVEVAAKRSPGAATDSAGGFDEIRVPGLRIREHLRPPRLAETALAGRDLSRSGLSYLFARTTGDDPYRRGRITAPPRVVRVRDRAEAEAELIRGAGDPEQGLDRVFTPPAARSWRADGWASVDPRAADDRLDRLTGADLAGVRLTSASRFQGVPARRASSAFDGDPRTAWVGSWVAGQPAWLAWSTPTPATVRTLRIAPGPARARVPTRVRLRAPGRASPTLAVGPAGEVRLPRALRARRFRLEILATRGPRGRAPAAVAIGALTGPGVPRVRVARTGSLAAPCGALAARVSAPSPRRLAMRPAGTLADFDAGRPLRARSCGAAAELPAARVVLRSGRGLFRPEQVRLRSPAPVPVARAALAPPRVLDPGTVARGRHEGIRLSLPASAWLVLGESYNQGWEATCDGRSLGPPQVIDGFANGWRAPAGCRNAAFRFAPQGGLNVAYVLGALACLVLLGVLLRGGRRRDPSPAREAPEPIAVDDRALPWPRRRAVMAGLAAAAVFGFVFSLRAGVLIGPAVGVILWRGVRPRTLILTAGVLLAVVVPLVYLLFPAEDRGGYNNEYAIEHLGAHWVAVAAFVLLVLALGRALSRASRPSGDPAPGPAAEPAPPVPA